MQTSVKHTLHRRQFLGTLAATTAVGLAGLAPFHLQAAQQQQGSTEGGTSGFEAWLGKIHGKHKQVFDSPHHVNGLPFAWARVFLMTNESSGVAKDDVQAVMVLRHSAIPLAMESGLWKKYNFAKVFEVKNEETKAPLTQNVFWQPKQGMLPLPGMGINELLDSGVLIGVCDMALTVYSKGVAEKMKKDAAEVKKEWVAGILPGIQLVPSGVLAVNRAQEHGCTYCFAG